MIQGIIVAVVIACSLSYVVRYLIRIANGKDSCSSGCGGCNKKCQLGEKVKKV